MTDEITPPQDNTDNPPAGAKKAEIPPIPYEDFKAINDKLRSAEKQLADLEKAKRDSETSILAEQGKYKELYEAAIRDLESLKTASEEARQYRQSLEATNQSRIARIPEDKRSLIPEYDNPVKLGAWLDANEALISQAPKPIAPNLGGGAGGSKPASPVLSDSLENLTRIARELGYNVDSERVASYAKKPIKPSNEGDK